MFTDSHIGKVVFYDVYNKLSKELYRNYITYIHDIDMYNNFVVTDYCIPDNADEGSLNKETLSCDITNLDVTIHKVMSFNEFKKQYPELLI
ncbi:MAG: hypothetical protein PVF17_01500 [Ignavibacteria bacterium]|jgi:hypothetical protein